MPQFTVYLIKDEYSFEERYLVSGGNVTENRKSVFNDGITTSEDYHIVNYLSSNKIEYKHICKSNSSINVYYRNSNTPNPWWKNYWNMPESLENRSVDLAVLIELNRKKFIVTHGHGRFLINPLSIVYDFGLKTALNLIDNDKIKTIDLFTPSEIALRSRKQSGKKTKIERYDINIFTSLLKNVSGTVRNEYAMYFDNIDGADSIKFSFNGNRERLFQLIIDLYEKYQLDTYKTQDFYWVDNFRIVKDKEMISILDDQLISAINEKNPDVVLSFPDIIDRNVPVYFKYIGIVRRNGDENYFPELDILTQYYKVLEDNEIAVSINDLKRQQIVARDMHNERDIISQKMYHCVYFDLNIHGSHYFIDNGAWYKVDEDFIQKIDENCKRIVSESREVSFAYDKCQIASDARQLKKGKEYIFNNKLTDYLIQTCSAECMDTLLVDKIEVCDVITCYDGSYSLFHNKYKYGSSALSHLFSQGYVSCENLTDEKFRKKANKKITKKELKFCEYGDFNRSKYTAVYGIISPKNRYGEFTLPLFSRINLHLFHKSVTTLGYNCEVVFFEVI